MLNILLVLTVLNNAQPTESILVSKIFFQGNKTFKTKILKKIISIKEKEMFYSLYLDKDINALSLLYQNQGFLNAVIESEIKSTPKGFLIYYKITEGHRIKISSIKLFGIFSFPEKRIWFLLRIKSNDYLIVNKIDEAEKTIARLYKNSGYPYINIERKISVTNNYASLEFLVTEGPLVHIAELKVRGNQHVSSRIILRTTEINQGEKFSLSRLEKARQRLYATRLFERVSFYILDGENKDSVTIRFDVLELPPRSIGFGLGVQTPPTRLLLSSEWEHLNFLSKGHDLFFSVSYAPTLTGDWRNEIKSIYRIFYVLNTPINFYIQPGFKYEEQDSIKQNELNIEAGLSRYIGPKFEVGSYLRYLRVWTNLPSTFFSQAKSMTNSQNFYLRFDTRDNLFTPERGIFFSTNWQIAGSIFDGDNDFYKTQSELSAFYPILYHFVFGCRLMTGLAIPYGRTTVVPYFEAFNLGGNNGLRGYADKTLGPIVFNDEHYGEAISNINIELRTHLEKLIDFVTFFDIGKVSARKNFTDIKPAMFQYSSGAGIRINTPIGPIRLDYAKRLKDPPSGDWGKIHLALLNAF